MLHMGDIKDIGQFALSWKGIEELKTPLWALIAVMSLLYVLQAVGEFVNLGAILVIVTLIVFIAVIVAFWKYLTNIVMVKALSLKGYNTRTISFLNYIAYYILFIVAMLIPWFGGNYLLFQIGTFLLGVAGIALIMAKITTIGYILAAVGFGIYVCALVYTSLRISLSLHAYLSGTGGIKDALRRSWDVTNNNLIEATLIRMGNWIYGVKEVLLIWVVGIVLSIIGMIITLQTALQTILQPQSLSNTTDPVAVLLGLISSIIITYVSVFVCFVAAFGDSAVLAMLEGKNGSKAKKTA